MFCFVMFKQLLCYCVAFVETVFLDAIRTYELQVSVTADAHYECLDQILGGVIDVDSLAMTQGDEGAAVDEPSRDKNSLRKIKSCGGYEWVRGV